MDTTVLLCYWEAQGIASCLSLAFLVTYLSVFMSEVQYCQLQLQNTGIHGIIICQV